MKGFFPLLIGLFGTFTFSWLGLTVIPNLQIGRLSPQSDEEGTDIYPMPQSGMVARGRHVYVANGCIYCHSQQLRPDYAASDLDRERDYGPQPGPKWGQRRSAPRDYIFDRPVVLGTDRMGPDLADIAKAAPGEQESAAPPAGPSPGSSPASPSASPAASAAPASPSPAASPPMPASTTGEPPAYSAAWHHQHLYSPRSFNGDSNMPAYRFLYEKRLIAGQRAADALQLTGPDAPPAGWEIVPTYDARCLVAYLMSLDQSHPLKEVKSAAPSSSPPTASPAAAKGAK